MSILMAPGTTFTGPSSAFYSAVGNQWVVAADVPTALTLGWIPAAGAASLKQVLSQPARVVSIGTSHQAMGFYLQNLSTTAGSFVISNGIATLTTSSNSQVAVGNNVFMFNKGDPAFSAALNGAAPQVLSCTSNTVFTCSATYNGQTMPDGDYSSIGGSGWTIATAFAGLDSSVVKYLNYRSGNPLQWVGNYAIVGGQAVWSKAILPKIFAGPKFDLAIIDAGTNEIGGTPSASLQACLAGAQDAYDNLVYIAQQIIAYGARVIIMTNPPYPTTVTNSKNGNLAQALLRTQLVEFANQTQGVYLFDLWKDVINGTAANGDMVANYAHASNDVHTSSYADYIIGGQETAILTSLCRPQELAPASILEDASTNAQLITAWTANTAYTVTTLPATYVTNLGNIYQLLVGGTSAPTGLGPSGSGAVIQDGGCVWGFVAIDARNLVPHGMMDGTVAVAGVTGASGTLPTGWTIQNTLSNCTLVSTGQVARTGPASTNQANWGYMWTLAATFSAAGSFTLFSGDWGSLWRSAVANFGGGWFRFGIDVIAQANFSAINQLSAYLKVATATSFMQPSCAFPGNNTTSIPMLNGDILPYVSDPFYVSPGIASTQSQMFLTCASSASGSASFAIAGAWCKRVPYGY